MSRRRGEEEERRGGGEEEETIIVLLTGALVRLGRRSRHASSLGSRGDRNSSGRY
jgi:hypothetical protein